METSSGRVGRIEASIELLFQILDTAGDEGLGDFAPGGDGENLLGGSHCGIGRRGTHVVQRLRLGLADLGLRHLGPPRDEVLHTDLGLVGKPLGLRLGPGNNGFGLALRGATLALKFGKQCLGLLAQPPGLAKFGGNARLTVIERVGDPTVPPQIAEHRQEDDEGDCDPGFW
jgi:hypothetical protein